MAATVSDQVMTLRKLNRATLARQLLLVREPVTAVDAIERLAGLQAQDSAAPFIGLWTRLSGFTRAQLSQALLDKTVIKATAMRATLHILSAADYLHFRTTLQPMLTGAAESIVKQRGAIDLAAILEAARQFLAERPRSMAAISEMLTAAFPAVDIGSMRYSVRLHLPLVQVPTTAVWSFPGNPEFTLAEPWLGGPVATASDLQGLIRRYLAAFGPATVTDLQTWSGFPKLKAEVEHLRPTLLTFRDETKRELFDLPDAPRPDEASAAPVRFLPPFDNLLLAHDKRTRIIAEAHRKRVYLPGLRVAATFLVDGFVRGTWQVKRVKSEATLAAEPFEPLTAADRAALLDEAEQLVRFCEPAASTYHVQIAT